MSSSLFVVAFFTEKSLVPLSLPEEIARVDRVSQDAMNLGILPGDGARPVKLKDNWDAVPARCADAITVRQRSLHPMRS